MISSHMIHMIHPSPSDSQLAIMCPREDCPRTVVEESSNNPAVMDGRLITSCRVLNCPGQVLSTLASHKYIGMSPLCLHINVRMLSGCWHTLRSDGNQKMTTSYKSKQIMNSFWPFFCSKQMIEIISSNLQIAPNQMTKPGPYRTLQTGPA